jgi:outer membrane beta-barrel protein
MAIMTGDDSPSREVRLDSVFPEGLYFFGSTFRAAWININGNVTFGNPYSTFTPAVFPSAPYPMIAPWWADIDLRALGTTNAIYTALDGPNQRWIVTWLDVGYYRYHDDKLNSFQMIVTNRADIAPGDFDVEFRYNRLEWTTGDVTGFDGFGGSPAVAGFDAGNRRHYEVLPGSGSADVLSLLTGSNIAQPGVWLIEIRSGFVHIVELPAEAEEPFEAFDPPVAEILEPAHADPNPPSVQRAIDGVAAAWQRRSRPILLERRYVKEERHFIGVYGGLIPNDPFVESYPVGLRYGYYVTDELGLELDGSVIGPELRSDTELTRFMATFGHEPDVPDLASWRAHLGLSWNPMYTKLAFLNQKLFHFDIAFYLGAGVVSLEIDDAPRFEGSIGLGLNVFLSENFSLRLDWRQFLFEGEDGGVSHPAELSLGLGLFR